MTEAATRHPYAGHTRGTPCWASLMVHGLAAAQEFYGGLFGWEFRAGPQQMGPYVRALVDGREVAGLGQMARGQRLRVAWLPYLATESADTTAALIRESGGTVAVGPMDAESAGRVAIAADPVGASFGVWQAAGHLGLGTAEAGAPGTPVWYELVCRSTEPLAAFYVNVFGHTTERQEPVAGATDCLKVLVDGRPVAGMHGVGEAVPRDRGPHWKTYFAVPDVDEAVRRVRELGGRVAREPREVPHGRVATVTDPEGAHFSLLRSPDAPA